MLKRNSNNEQTPAGRIGDFGNFLNDFAKSPRVLRWS